MLYSVGVNVAKLIHTVLLSSKDSTLLMELVNKKYERLYRLIFSVMQLRWCDVLKMMEDPESAWMAIRSLFSQEVDATDLAVQVDTVHLWAGAADNTPQS